MVDAQMLGAVGIVVFLLLVLQAVWRSKTLTGALAGRESLYIADLKDLFQDDEPIEIRHIPANERSMQYETAVQIFNARASVIYYRSRHLHGVIETMDLWVRGKSGKLLKYENEKCIGYAGVGPNRPLFPLPSPEARQCANVFGKRIRTIVEQHLLEPP